MCKANLNEYKTEKMKSELKAKYKKDFKTVTVLMNEFDPFRLIEGGSPNDEYDSLTQKLLSYFYAQKAKQDIKSLIIEDIEREFGKPSLREIQEPFKSKFNSSLDNLLDRIETKIGIKHTA
jgi:hypothetical protein